MLVYYRFPKGSTIIEGRRVYGFLEKFPATKISWQSYRLYRKDLLQAPYDKETLESMFPGSAFPDVAFTYSELRYLEWEHLCALCKGFNITTSRQNKLRRKELAQFMKEHC